MAGWPPQRFFAPRASLPALEPSYLNLPSYFGTLVPAKGEVAMAEEPKLIVERVQTGVRMEKRILKVLKAFGE